MKRQMSDCERWLWKDMTSHPSMFKADHYSAIRQNKMTKTTKRDKCTTKFAFRNGKSSKAGKHHTETRRKTFVLIIIIIILLSSNAALIFNSGSARLEFRARYWLSWLNFRWFPRFPSGIYRDGVLNSSRQLPSSPFPIHHSSIIL